MASGWANVGSAIAGNPARQAALYEQGATGTARLEGLLSEARRRRDEEAGYSGITPEAISAAQSDPAQAPALVAAMFHAGINPTQLSGYNKEALGTTIQQDAYGRASRGEPIAAINPLLAVMAGKPVEVSNVKDGVSFNPYATPDQNRFDPTQVGLAEIMQKGAQADAEHASAANSYASAARTRAGIGLDKAANYDIVDTPDGLVRVPKLGGAAVPVTFQDGSAVTKAPKATAVRQPNNEQTLAAGFANRMVASTKELDALTDGGYDPTNFRDRTAASVGGYLGNEATSVTGQQFRQAATNWVRANLRKESGAAIGKDEMDSEIENYFPKAGDSAEVVAQKARNREQVNANMIQAAGPAWRGAVPAGSAVTQTVPAAAAAVSAPAASGGHQVGDVLTVGGKQYRVTGGDPNDPDLEPL
jgi:hypothetical protein